MRIAALLLAIVFAAPALAQRAIVCPVELLDLQAIEGIVTKRTCAGIDSAYRRLIAPDAVTKLVYAVHRVRQCPGATSDDLLIDSLPKDELTFHLAYSLTDPNVKIDRRAVTVAGEYLLLALEAVIRRGRGARAFLMQGYLISSNAHTSELLPDLHADFRRRAPKLFREGYRRLPAEAQRYVSLD